MVELILSWVVMFLLSIFLGVATAGGVIILISSDEILHIIGAFLGLAFVVFLTSANLNPICVGLIIWVSISLTLISIRRYIRNNRY